MCFCLIVIQSFPVVLHRRYCTTFVTANIFQNLVNQALAHRFVPVLLPINPFFVFCLHRWVFCHIFACQIGLELLDAQHNHFTSVYQCQFICINQDIVMAHPYYDESYIAKGHFHYYYLPIFV